MSKEEFKNKVLRWLTDEKVNISGKKVRVYNSPRYGLEVRIYQAPMEMQNSRRSRRKMPVDENGYNCMTGIFSRKISLYTHINESDFNNPKEKVFILETIKTA